MSVIAKHRRPSNLEKKIPVLQYIDRAFAVGLSCGFGCAIFGMIAWQLFRY